MLAAHYSQQKDQTTSFLNAERENVRVELNTEESQQPLNPTISWFDNY